MLSTPHLMVGAAIVRSIPNPYISLPAAFLSHFLFDFIPHWDFSVSLKPNHLIWVLVDYGIGLSLVYFLSFGERDQALILLGGITATLPDFILGGWKVLEISILNIPPIKSLNNFHQNIQNRVSIFWGSLISIITILVSAYILVK